MHYNEKRARARIERGLKDDEEYKKKLLELYNRAMDEIVREMEAAYTRYAISKGIPFEEANKRVSKFEVKSFGDRAKKYVEEKDFSDKANYELRLYNLKMRMSRLDLMKREILLRTAYLADREEAMLSSRLKEEALSTLEEEAGILGLDKKARKKMIKDIDSVVDFSFDGVKFSDRIWTSQAELQASLERGLTRTILRGENPKDWSVSLRNMVRDELVSLNKKNALYVANRLAITESARVQVEVLNKTLKAGGYDKFVWIAEPDGKTCTDCKIRDGEVYDLDDKIQPPLHPFCRCSIAAYYGDKEGDLGYNESEAIEIQPEENIRAWIKDHDKVLNKEKFEEHDRNSKRYDGKKSYLLIDYAKTQKLIRGYAGSGELRTDKNGKWTKKEFISHSRYIGVVNGRKTKRFSIDYKNKKWVHIVPREEEE